MSYEQDMMLREYLRKYGGQMPGYNGEIPGASPMDSYDMNPVQRDQPQDQGWNPDPAARGDMTPYPRNALAKMFNPMDGDTRLGNAGTVTNQKNALNTMFQGAISGGDLDQAERLATTPEQKSLLSVAYGQSLNDREARGKAAAGQTVQPQGNLVDKYRADQATQLGLSRAEEDRQLKIQQMKGQIAKTDAETTNLNLKPAVPPVPPHYDADRGVFVSVGPNGEAKVITPPGLPNSNKPLTESQAKAAGIGSRAQAAHDILTNLETSGTLTPGLIKQFAESVPLTGGVLGPMVNSLPSQLGGPTSDQQRVEQAQRDFVNAALRVESGASISQSEFDNARKQYFPQPGDSKDAIKQKQENRTREIQSLGIQAGKGNASITAAAKSPVSNYTDADLKHTAMKYGISVDEVKRKLGI